MTKTGHGMISPAHGKIILSGYHPNPRDNNSLVGVLSSSLRRSLHYVSLQNTSVNVLRFAKSCAPPLHDIHGWQNPLNLHRRANTRAIVCQLIGDGMRALCSSREDVLAYTVTVTSQGKAVDIQLDACECSLFNCLTNACMAELRWTTQLKQPQYAS